MARTPLQDETSSAGERLADQIAKFGGSWTFIGLAIAMLLAWTAVNTWLLAPRGHAFDPYPFVFLNLLLSMLAALQAPVIMMSQNRQADRDRIAATRDFEVNQQAEREIAALQRKLEELHGTDWRDLIVLQREQIRLLNRLLEAAAPDTAQP